MTGPMIFAPDYYQRMRDLEASSWWNAAMRDVARRMLRRSGLPVEGVMLDLGCGSGQTMSWFASHWPQWTRIGLDVSRDGLVAARQAGGETVFGASALDIPLPAGSVDCVITLDVLQHLPLGDGDTRALREIRRVLRPGGVVFIRTNAQSWPPTDDDPAHDFHKYRLPELRRKLEKCGLTVEAIGRLNSVLGLAEIRRELRAKRVGGEGYVGLLADVPRHDIWWQLKRAWLGLEGAAVSAGLSLPLGRTLVAMARRVA